MHSVQSRRQNCWLSLTFEFPFGAENGSQTCQRQSRDGKGHKLVNKMDACANSQISVHLNQFEVSNRCYLNVAKQHFPFMKGASQLTLNTLQYPLLRHNHNLKLYQLCYVNDVTKHQLKDHIALYINKSLANVSQLANGPSSEHT